MFQLSCYKTTKTRKQLQHIQIIIQCVHTDHVCQISASKQCNI